jgi:hypothetical protein
MWVLLDLLWSQMSRFEIDELKCWDQDERLILDLRTNFDKFTKPARSSQRQRANHSSTVPIYNGKAQLYNGSAPITM